MEEEQGGDSISSKAISGAQTGAGGFTSNIIQGGVSWAVVAGVGLVVVGAVVAVVVWRKL